MEVLYIFLTAAAALGLAWLLIYVTRRSTHLFILVLALLYGFPVAFVLLRFKFDLDPNATLGLIAGSIFLITVIALSFMGVYFLLRKRPVLMIFAGVLAYAAGYLIALTVGVNIGLFQK